jgi:GDP-L-fucose synthase
MFDRVVPTHVIHCASYSGGIAFNAEHQADIWLRNTHMAANLFEACRKHGVQRLVLPISNCAYPGASSVFREREFWEGDVHPSVRSYGATRRALVVGADAYRAQYGLDSLCLVLSNMYGPGDHTDPVRAHALGGLVVRMLQAKRAGEPTFTVWGSGRPVREWLYVGDGAEALVRGLTAPSHAGVCNVGWGEGVSMAGLAGLIRDAIGYKGELVYDTTKPDGAPHKAVDGTGGRSLLGWGPQVTLAEGLARTVAWAEGAVP